MASARIAATNKLSHRLSTLPVADFSASSNVKCFKTRAHFPIQFKSRLRYANASSFCMREEYHFVSAGNPPFSRTSKNLVKSVGEMNRK